MSRNSLPREAKTIGAFLAFGIAIEITLMISGGKTASGSARPQEASMRGVPASRPAVLVELFTSEGCSSCPPADKLLAWLGENQPVPGVEIIPLSEHVDYWNHLGWADPYSSPIYSNRQRDYSGSLGAGTYTPQMVVDGRVELVGSDSHKAIAAISGVAGIPGAKVSINPVESEPSSGSTLISFSIRVDKIPLEDAKKKSLVFLAVTENNLRSSVAAGENSGRTLAHIAVVRELKMIGKVDARPDASFAGQPSVAIAKDWKRSDLRAVVFVQVQGNHKILGAAESAFPGD